MAEYIEREAAIKAVAENDYEGYATWAIKAIPAADVVSRDCYDRLLAENDDMRAIVDTYGGLENIQSAFVKLHEIENADVVPVRHGRWMEHKSWAKCSECGYLLGFETPYCPDCGARMDGGGDV